MKKTTANTGIVPTLLHFISQIPQHQGLDYFPRNMHPVSFCFGLAWLYRLSICIRAGYLAIIFELVLLTLGQRYDDAGASESEVTLKDMG